MGAIIRLDERHARAYVAEPHDDVCGRVLVVHDAYGLLAHVRFLCDELAAHGFVAIAPDLFAGATTRSDSEASRLLEGLSTARAAQVLDAALRAFETVGHGDGPIAAVGFSVGAEFAFGMVADGRLQAIVAYYGLPSDEDRDRVGVPVLLHLAGAERWDEHEGPDDVIAALRAGGVAVVAHSYEGALHGFGNADIDAFDLDAAAAAWQRSLEFLATRMAA